MSVDNLLTILPLAQLLLLFVVIIFEAFSYERYVTFLLFSLFLIIVCLSPNEFSLQEEAVHLASIFPQNEPPTPVSTSGEIIVIPAAISDAISETTGEVSLLIMGWAVVGVVVRLYTGWDVNSK